MTWLSLRPMTSQCIVGRIAIDIDYSDDGWKRYLFQFI